MLLLKVFQSLVAGYYPRFARVEFDSIVGERRRAGEKLRESEELFRLSIENVREYCPVSDGKDRHRFWAQWVTEPVRGESGEVRGIAKLLRDETERKSSQKSGNVCSWAD